MFAMLATVLALTAAPTAMPATATSPLPGSPRDVRVESTSAGNVLTWRRPASSGATQITGYVVIGGEDPVHVDADTLRVAVPAGASQLAVAAMNGVGCSVATDARVPAASVEVRRALVASR